MQKKMPLIILLMEVLAICVLHAFRISNADHAPKHPRFSVSTFSSPSRKVANSGDQHFSSRLYHFIK
jgi:hypothetical protein